MASSKTILVPIDFQDASLAALAVARDLAKQLELEVVLLHVYTLPIFVYPGFDPIVAPGLPEEMAAAAKGALDRLAATSGRLRSLLRSGDPASQILAAIDETRPTLVAMGTHGRKGLSNFLIGSVAEKVLRSSTVPVLTVRAPGK